MTRKDFIAIAEALRAAQPQVPSEAFEARFLTWSRCVDEVADALARTNSNFIRSRFVAACGDDA